MQYTTTYRRASTVAAVAGLWQVFLAALQREETKPAPKPWLFRGMLAQPLIFRDGLLTLREVVAARFYRPDLWRLLDPVVTTEEEWVRLECFSSCAGVYTRVDLRPDVFESGDLGGEGTTNVEFGADFAAQLSRLRPGRESAFEVSEECVALAGETGTAVERKVDLPERWLRGFLQVQAIQRASEPRFELAAGPARQLLSALPGTGAPVYATAAGQVLANPGRAAALGVGGLHRLKLLCRMAPHVQRLQVWAVADHAPSFWVADLGAARVTMGLSSATNQGFSGDGEALRSARRELDEVLVACARHLLGSGRRFTTAELAEELDVPAATAGQLVDLFSEQGLLGYDLPEGRFYPRALPYVTRTGFVAQPRDVNARRLLAAGRAEVEAVTPVAGGRQLVGWVKGDTATYRVKVTVDPEGTILDGDCTCRWILDHGMQRGPCKHILALRLAGDEHGE
ncbi:MAG: SWIM zinc finger family protein [Armatimonadetes bacterium]|nr:SWIM zinc finger family protein [Armatimonadota bacterium]